MAIGYTLVLCQSYDKARIGDHCGPKGNVT
jgi:hypothetical protein